MKNVGAYAKSLVPLLITALYGVQSALSDGKVTSTEWGGIVTGLVASLGAFLVPNATKPSAAFTALTADAKNLAYTPPVTVPQVTVDNPSAPVDASPLIPPDTTS